MKKLLVIILGIVLVAGCTKEDKPELPTISTTDVSDITPTSAISGGNITADGGAPITVRGIVWSTLANPTIDLSTKTNDGTGTSSFLSSIIGLTANTKYYVRAYATNEAGTAYGTEVSFTTLDGIIVLTTNQINTITPSSAASGGSISSDGGVNITAKGLVWSTSTNPTIALNTKTNEGSGINAFSSTVTGLNLNTKYYVRAYATNIIGTFYGSEVNFTTPTSLGAIGSQIWDTTNLNVVTYSDGTPIPQVTDPTQWRKLTTGAWCYFNNDSAKGTTYGKLYNWFAVAGIYNEASKTDITKRKKLAPTGYHIPSDSEWTILTDYLGGENAAASKIKEAGMLHWASYADGINTSGFNGLPGNCRYPDGTFYDIGMGYWWTSSEENIPYYFCRILGAYVAKNGFYQTYGLSVRCVKD